MWVVWLVVILTKIVCTFDVFFFYTGKNAADLRPVPKQKSN